MTDYCANLPRIQTRQTVPPRLFVPHSQASAAMANKLGLPKDESDWNSFKDIITELYIGRNEKLSNVIDLMYENHGFWAR